jgi:hypothetical protein
VTVSRRYLWCSPPPPRPVRGDRGGDYGYQDWSASGSSSWAYNSVDLFSVGLRLHGGEEWHLFYFYGDGTFSNQGPLPDWLYWEQYLFDLSGSQERESRVFVELLGKIIGAPVVPA